MASALSLVGYAWRMVRGSRLAVLLVLGLALSAFLIWRVWLARSAPVSTIRKAPAPIASAAPSSLVDPLFSGHPALLDSVRPPLGPNWVHAPPDAKSQYSRKAAERGGVEPCGAPPSSAEATVSPLSRGYLFIPDKQVLDGQGSFDLVIHLHGESPVRRELVARGAHQKVPSTTKRPSAVARARALEPFEPLQSTSVMPMTVVTTATPAVTPRRMFVRRSRARPRS